MLAAAGEIPDTPYALHRGGLLSEQPVRQLPVVEPVFQSLVMLSGSQVITDFACDGLVWRRHDICAESFRPEETVDFRRMDSASASKKAA